MHTFLCFFFPLVYDNKLVKVTETINHSFGATNSNQKNETYSRNLWATCRPEKLVLLITTPQ